MPSGQDPPGAPALFVQQWRPRPKRRLTGLDHHEAALRRRPARDVQDLQGHDLRDAPRSVGARPRAARVRGARPGLGARRPGQRAGPHDRAGGAEQRNVVRRDRGAGADRARRCGRGRDAQGPAVRQRVLLRDAPARAGRARRRTRVQPAARAARASREARDPRVPAIHRADDRHARRSGDQALPRRARRHRPEAARRHGRHGHLPGRPGRPQPRQHHRNAQPQRHRRR